MKIRETKQIPVIILSAKTEESDKVSGLIMGADDYITKPFVRETVLKRIDNVMELVSRKNNRRRKNDIADKLSELFG